MKSSEKTFIFNLIYSVGSTMYSEHYKKLTYENILVLEKGEGILYGSLQQILKACK